MSALDQAFIKAYGKPTATPRDTQPPASGPAAVAVVPGRAAAPPHAQASAIERLYHEGTLYRVDLPAKSNVQARLPAAGAVPAPHVVPPPTSPRRGMRRSLLKLVAGQPAIPTASAEQTPPRVQRKVIIRHVSHRAPPPVGLVPPPHFLPHPTPAANSVAELAPEFVSDHPAVPTTAPLTTPTTPPLPSPGETSPQNEFEAIVPSALVEDQWQGAAIEPLVVLPEHADLAHSAPQSVVSVQFDAFPEPAPETIIGAECESLAPASFATKSLQDDRSPSIRIDAAHGPSPHRPHVRFGTATAPAQQSATSLEPHSAELSHEPPPDPKVVETGGGKTPESRRADIDLADPGELSELALEAAVEETASAPLAAQTAPVWEVDQFQWPRVCDRLLADRDGYFAQAGAKLLAAMHDGLKTLAVTGTRRGEGRTTLALCLARVAARAGIQVALIDADFARPQVATRLGLEITHGWQDAALGHIPLSEAAIKSLADDVTVLPLEITAVRRSLSLADPRVTATLRAAAATFDLVIVDLGPIAPGEALTFPQDEDCPLDAIIVVRDLRFATLLESENLGARLYEAGVEAVGIAENFVADEEAGL